jgi:hypothetical protein
MKNFAYLSIIVALLFANEIIYSQSYVYVSPKNNSSFVSLSSNIILKSDANISPASLSTNKFIVVGSKSGAHQGIVKLSDDNKTILYIPKTQFVPNEDVSVFVNSGIKTTEGKVLVLNSFHFKTTPQVQKININPFVLSENEVANNSASVMRANKSSVKNSVMDSLPSDFPAISLDSTNVPSTGSIFLANNSLTPTADPYGNFIMTVNNEGNITKYKRTNGQAMDFKVQPNGNLSFAQLTYAQVINQTDLMVLANWIVMDTSFTPIDTFMCGNGYAQYTDVHDFILLPNGHALLFASDPEPFDMSQFGGSPSAIVIGAVIQELDASKNVVFQWRSWDYLPMTDSYMDLTTSTIDPFHGNALDADANSNILFSMRHTSSVIKIDRQTGDVDWIMGGKRNQFTFLDEHASNSPNYFSYQHNIHVLSNGNITLFDNGNQHVPPYSRAIEYKIDEQNKTADLVWEYTHTPGIFSMAMGSVQRLTNGNTLIGWGYASITGSPAFTEIHPDNSTALEMYIPLGLISYRAYKFPWVSQTPGANVDLEVLQGNTYKFNSPNDTTGVTIKFDLINSSLYANTIVTKYNYAPIKPVFTSTAPLIVSNYFNIKGLGITSYTGEVQVNLYDYPAITNPNSTIVYSRAASGNTFAPVPTSYDSTKNVLTFTTTSFGDFAFGVPQTVDSSYTPVPLVPRNNQIVNGLAPVKLVWGTRGIVQTYHLQVSTDSLFSNTLVDNSGLMSTFVVLSTINNNSKYYWRVNNTNTSGTGNWSYIESFSTASPFLSILFPNGGDKLYLDSTYVIRWVSNIIDTVNIKLINGNNITSVIGDSIFAGTNAFKWQVPSNVKQDSTYTVMISGISNPSLSSSSNSVFNISSRTTGINDLSNTVMSYELSQNYPNPFNPSTFIQYSIPQESHVQIDVFNIIGQRITTLVNGIKKPGNYEISWNASNLSSGVYIYSIKAIGNTGQTFFAIKKMMLLK